MASWQPEAVPQGAQPVVVVVPSVSVKSKLANSDTGQPGIDSFSALDSELTSWTGQ